MQTNRSSIIKVATLIALLTTTIVFSCKKEEVKYSCDEKANEYALMHIKSSQNISRDSLVKLERGLQFAVFRSLTPENKKRIFNEKIDLILATTDLNDKEKSHLLAARNYSDPSIYEDDDDKEIPFITKWIATAKSELGWTDNMIQGMLGVWATPEELVTMTGMTNMEKKGNNCTCKYDIGCAAVGDCRGGSCTTTPDGCGFFGRYSCTGNCPEDRIKPSSGLSK